MSRIAPAALLLAFIVLGVAVMPASGQQPLDYPVANGHFYTQANGKAGEGGTGFAVSNNDNIPFLTEYRRMGGPSVLGYPVSRRFMWDGFVSQAFQKVVFQWRPDQGNAVLFVNVFDKANEAAKDDYLKTVRNVPNQIKLDENGKTFDQIKAGRLALLDANPAIKKYYLDVQGDPIILNGLPTSAVEDFGNVFVLRAQRVVFQQWKIDVPWAKAGTVQVANGGDVGKELGLYPDAAVAPEPANSTGGTVVPAKGSAPAATPAPAVANRPAAGSPVPAVANPPAAGTPAPAVGATTYPRQLDRVWKLQPGTLKETPNAEWIIVKLHQLTACENSGNGIGILQTLNAAGQPIDGINVRTESGPTVFNYKTGEKGPGMTEAYFYRGNWTAWVLDGPSDYATNMDTVLWADLNIKEEYDNVYCDGKPRNSPNHYSYEVIWRKRS